MEKNCNCPDVMATRPDALQSLRRLQLSFVDTVWEDSLHPSECQGKTVRTPRSLKRKLCTYVLHPFGRRGYTVRTRSYYGNYVQKKCNHLDAKVTPSECGPDMVLREARYGKSVTQLSVWMLLATVWTLLREIQFRFDLGLL